MLKTRYLIPLVIIIVLGISIVAMTLYLRNIPSRQIGQSSLIVPVSAQAIPTSIVLPITSSVKSNSSDGTMVLTINKQIVDKVTTQSIVISNPTDNSETMIFSKTEQSVQELTIPHNSWSPDNMHVFIKESIPTGTNYLVFYASGQPFNTNVPFINVYEQFLQKYPEYIFEEITGWAAPNLLIINAHKSADSEGTSFWFDVSNQTFTLLSTHFK